MLLKWLLGGEYVPIPTLAPGVTLPGILKTLAGEVPGVPGLQGTGIPRLEGHEWANLQLFNLAKGQIYLRLKGAAESPLRPCTTCS